MIRFDEVQLQPLARQAIKHLVKDHRYDYIETGSLISVRSRSRDILVPSEETKVDMYPMDYEEFRWALGDTTTIPLLRTAFEKKMPLGDAVHRKLMRDFRLYMLVGGMPQAVSAYIRTNNFTAVDQAKRDIIALYEEDFGKIDDSEIAVRPLYRPSIYSRLKPVYVIVILKSKPMTEDGVTYGQRLFSHYTLKESSQNNRHFKALFIVISQQIAFLFSAFSPSEAR